MSQRIPEVSARTPLVIALGVSTLWQGLRFYLVMCKLVI